MVRPISCAKGCAYSKALTKERLEEVTALLNEAYSGWEVLEQLKNEPGTA